MLNEEQIGNSEPFPVTNLPVYLINSEQIGISEPFPVTNLPDYLINSEQIGISEQFCDDQKVPYYQVWLYYAFVWPISRKKGRKKVGYLSR